MAGVIVVFFYTIAAFWQACLTRTSLIASSRAWIGPSEAWIEGFSPDSKEALITIKYRNSGKQPGLNFSHSYLDDWTATITKDEDTKPLNLSSYSVKDGQTVQTT